MPPEVAAAAEGVPEDVFTEWLRRGAEGGGANGHYTTIFAQVQQAAAEAEATAVEAVFTGDAGWTSKRFWLQQRNPYRWDKRKKVDDDSSNSSAPADPFAEFDGDSA